MIMQIYYNDIVSASNLQQLKDHNVKSTETDVTAQKAVLSLCDKSGM